MRTSLWSWRTGLLGLFVVPLSGCGLVPVPKLLEPVFGSPATYTDTSICVVDLSATRGLRVAPAQKEEESGTIFLVEDGERRRLPASSSGYYAGAESWYREGEPIRQYGRRYVKYGSHRVVPASALTRGADHKGIPVFLDRDDTKLPGALYIPVEPGCIFQPYVDEQQAARE